MSQTGWAFYTREEPRRTIPDSQRAFVEFDYPNPRGPGRRFPLLDVSAAGVSFVLTRPLFGIEGGNSLNQVTVRLDSLAVEGEMLLTHVSQEPDGRTVCGGRFFPLTEDDGERMKQLLERLGSG